VHMEVTCNALWGKGVELAIIIIVCFDVWTIMDQRGITCMWHIPFKFGSYFFMQIALHADKVHIKATCYALWGNGVELAIIIIVYFDVWTIMDKRHYLLLTSQWIKYPITNFILLWNAQCMERRQGAYWGYILRPLGKRCGASNYHNSIFWRMNNHG
jgi:hypothetical protein